MTQDRPNILVIIADGLQARALGSAVTPKLDRLSGEGVTFTRAYTPLPTCSPARASLMTGLLPHNHGVLEVEHCVDDDQCVLRADKPHWAQRLVAAGYCTGYFGKWHIERSGRLDKFGWQINGSNSGGTFRDVCGDRGEREIAGLDEVLTHRLEGPEGYRSLIHYGVTDLPVDQRPISVAAGMATEFLAERASDDEPWCCCVSYSDPNEAMICSRETFEQCDVNAIDLPASLRDPLDARPMVYRRSQQIWDAVTDDQWRIARACYYARITELDGQVGRLLDVLDRTGQLNNTLIVFTADHGKYVGCHGMDAHNFGAFEEIYNIPLIVRGPAVAGGVRTEARVGLHDLCPTLLDLAGAEPIDVPDSRSFVAVLRDPAAAGEFTTGYAEYHGTRFRLTQRVCWDGSWKFVFNGFDVDELYDLISDPDEMTNLAADPAQAKRVRAMTAAIWERVRQTHDKPLLDSHYYSMRFGVVGPDIAPAAAGRTG